MAKGDRANVLPYNRLSIPDRLETFAAALEEIATKKDTIGYDQVMRNSGPVILLRDAANEIRLLRQMNDEYARRYCDACGMEREHGKCPACGHGYPS